MLEDKPRVLATDKMWRSSVNAESFLDHVFLRVSAKDVQFSGTDFRYSIFDGCYLRNCSFEDCNFTGCKFVGTNLHGSTFSGCDFSYTTFERTFIDSEILDSCCPSVENLKSRFARTLRTNYQTLGDAPSVNKAIQVELEATRTHLYKSWRSNEAYYRKKYKKWDRLKSLGQWLEFVALDLIWGNGESLLRLIASVAIFLLLISLADVFSHREVWQVSSYLSALKESPKVFLGVNTTTYSEGLVTLSTMVRLISLGLFMSIVIKRFARR